MLRDARAVATDGFVILVPLQPTSTLFPYTTLFRSLNSGTVSVQMGTLALGGNGTSSGTFGTSGGGVLEVGGTQDWGAATVTGTATVVEIGRASCRERGERWAGAGAVTEKETGRGKSGG